ncbi:outer membrane beta-barrel protein [Pedobacter sp. MR22-3]|uniref:outer membrane beta-barrel protein n=1 Tax=Pedobacter sp. MR22-3 TaxID=2994552 RepID=UPI00224684FD|nr:outer membrane beta-barrel protein [Pedobacter sp. MR22-3]MCX2584741.1 TonB-dependent receptor [Pedobacter sp. MR22-3]
MKFLYIFLLLIPFASFSQTKSIKIHLTDSITKQPIGDATLELKKKLDNQQATTKTNSSGNSSFTLIAGGKYEISAIAIGYKKTTKSFEIIQLSNDTLVVNLTLIQSSTNLSDINISVQKKIVKREIDRLIYKVSEDPDSKSLSLFEVLRKVPLISIDGEKNIRIKGSANFKVFIDNKPSALFSRNIADALRNIPASSILRIEVITSPPVKYDAEGLGGIINIIMIKKESDLYAAKFGVRYLTPDGPSGNASFSYAKKKFGFSLNGGISRIKSPETETILSRLSKTDNTNFLQNSLNNSKNNFQYGQFSSSYQFDSLKLLTVSASINGNIGKNYTRQSSRLFGNNNANIESYNLNYNDINSSLSFDINTNYELRFKKNNERILTFSYGYSQGNDKLDNNSDQFSDNQLLNSTQFNGAGRKENTFQVDLSYPVKKVQIEAGLKAILRKNFSDYWSQNPTNYIENNFDYNQNVFSFYNSYLFTTKSTDIKAGFRLERTYSSIDGFKDNSSLNPYFNFIPALSIQEKLSDSHSITASYTKRLERPGIWELNPFVNNIDPRNISFGNPYLGSSMTNNFELYYNYSGKVSLDIGTDYSFSKGNIEIVNLYDPVSNVFQSTYQNGSKKRNLGANISLSFKPTKSISSNLNSSVSYNKIEGQLNNDHYSNSGTTYNIYTSISKRFQKNYRVNINGSYNNGIVLLQGKTSSILTYSASVTKSLLKNNLNITASTTNPFRKYRYLENDRFTVDSYQTMRIQNYARQFSLGINYKFGKQKETVKESSKTISNDDLKSH